ncbi:MAG: hypothetical protein R2824_11810 [Saprospiraceae bacterium]|nr:hypothetical protein [Lewinella sp.]
MLLNWTEDKGDPYHKVEYRYEVKQYEIQTLDYEEYTQKFEELTSNETNCFSIHFPLSFYLWRICKITDPIFLELLSGKYYNNEYSDFESITDFNENPEDIEIDFATPLLVYSSYPFQMAVEIKIFPLRETAIRRQGESIPYNLYTPGYIIWQISLAYEGIYKNKWKEVGVWGHEFADLAFGSIKLYPGNIIKVNLES